MEVKETAIYFEDEQFNKILEFMDEVGSETIQEAVTDAIKRAECMNLNEYQELAMRTSNKGLAITQHFMNGILGLAGEAGECCDIVKKHYYQDGREVKDKLLDELGDVMWYIAETAKAMGFTLEEIAAHNIEKLKKRYPEGFDAEKSLHREENV